MGQPLTELVLADVRRLAPVAASGDLSRVREGLDRVLRRRLRHTLGALSTTDPATLLLTSCWVSGVAYDSGRERALFEGEFRGDDLTPYTALAQAEVPAARLHAVTDGDLSRARRWETILAPAGVRDELRVALRSRGTTWGTLTLYRTGDDAPFSPADEHAAAAASGPIADMFRLALLHAAAAGPHRLDDPPGVLLVGPDGDLVASTPAAQQWLDSLDDRGRLPSALTAVVAAVHGGHGNPRAALPSRDGRWVVLHAAPVKAEGTLDDAVVTVVVEGARPVTLAAVISAAHGLTPREAEVTSLVCLGLANKQVATRLGLSTYTVQDHLKSIFAKTGARSRGELVATLYATHHEPANQAGRMPSPYGWYLDDVAPAVLTDP